MNSDIDREKEDIRLFADPFEPFHLSESEEDWTADFYRDGNRYVTNRKKNGTFKVSVEGETSSYASFNSMLASPLFADLERLARAQIHTTKYLATEDGDEKRFLPVISRLEEDSSSRIINGIEDIDDFLSAKTNTLRVVVIDGAAGIGKSLLIERIMRRHASAVLNRTGQSLLLHVESRGRVLTALEDRIAGTLENLRAKFVQSEVAVLARRGLIIVAIDGFDELSDERGYERAWGALQDFIREIGAGGQVILAGRDTMLDRGSVQRGLGNAVIPNSIVLSRIENPDVSDIVAWLKSQPSWSEHATAANEFGKIAAENEYLRRPLFITQISELSPDDVVEGSGEPIVQIMEGFIKREGQKLTGRSSDISPEDASAVFKDFMAETARIMMDDETNSIDLDLLELLAEETFTGRMNDEMARAISQRVGSFGLLEQDPKTENSRKFPHETVRSYFFATFIYENILSDSPPTGLFRNPLQLEDFRVFNAIGRGNDETFLSKIRQRLLEISRATRSHDHLRSNILGIICSILPLSDEISNEPHPFLISDIDGRDIWLSETLGQAKASLIRITANRLDVRSADITNLQFDRCEFFEIIANKFTKFPKELPNIYVLIFEDESREERFEGGNLESKLKELTDVDRADRNDLQPAPEWYLLEKFARVSMRQYWIRVGDPSSSEAIAQKISSSDCWPALKTLLEEYGRLETKTNVPASGPQSQWFHLIAGQEFLRPDASSRQDTTEILRKLNAPTI